MTTKEQRELDEWIGNNVTLNFACIFEPNGTNNAICAKCNHDCRFEIHDFKHYTTDPAAAMEILSKCAKHLFEHSDCEESVSVSYDEPYWVVEKCNSIDDSMRTEGAGLEAQICLFAKKLFSK